MMELTEAEARALHDIVAYGFEPFIKHFKEKLGAHYISKHEQGAKSLFEAVAAVMPKHFAKMDAARNAFNSIDSAQGTSMEHA